MRRETTTAGIVAAGDKLLVGKRRPGGALSDKWEFPGGKLESGETPEMALRREFEEEFEIPVRVGRFLGETEFVHKDTRYRLMAYSVELVAEPEALHEHVRVGWFTAGELKELDLAASDRELLTVLEANRWLGQ